MPTVIFLERLQGTPVEDSGWFSTVVDFMTIASVWAGHYEIKKDGKTNIVRKRISK